MEDTIEILAANNLSAEDAGRTSSATRVVDIMSTNLVTLFAHHTFGQAVQLMTNSPFRHFLVIHADGRLAVSSPIEMFCVHLDAPPIGRLKT
jgi:CBS domain-containing protein